MAPPETLRAIPLFTGLRDADLIRIASVSTNRTYAKGAIIATEGTTEDALAIVLSGRVRIVQIGADGREVILGSRGPGEFFGEMALLDQVPRVAHVIVAERAQLMTLHRNAFQQLVNEVPGIAVGLLRTMCRRMYHAHQRIGGMALLDVDGRVARALLDYADRNDGVLAGPDVTHNAIGQIIGASRESVSRALSRFSERGWVETQRRRIELLDRAALERLAGTVSSQGRRAEDPPSVTNITD